MNTKNLLCGCAMAALFAPLLGHAAGAQTLAQNIYGGTTLPSQDSILENGPIYGHAGPLPNRQSEVQAAETNVHIGAAFMHTQYHENLSPGDDENGFTYGLTAGASALVKDRALPFNADLYAALNYDFSAGNLDYGGHYLVSGEPLNATDNAVFNRVEARFGLGFPLQGGTEIIPFIAAGYQSWDRNINQNGGIGTDEFYHSGLVGGGLKLDVPLTPALVASVTGEMLALVGGGITNNDFDVKGTFGVTGEERVELGLDYVISGPYHIFSSLYWQHFNYAGFKPTAASYGLYEPLSTTTQFGANIGFSYSFY